MIYNKLSKTTVIMTFIAIETLSIVSLIASFNHWQQPLSKILGISLAIFLNFIIFNELFKKSYMAELTEDRIILTSWGNLLLDKKETETIMLEEIKNAEFESIIESSELVINLKNGKRKTIDWNTLRNNEFRNLLSDIQSKLSQG